MGPTRNFTRRGFSGVISCSISALLSRDPARAGEARTLRVGGTGAATEFLKLAGAAFAAEGGVRVEVVPALGSTGGLRAVLDGLLGLCVSGRPLKDEETTASLRQAASLRTPFILVTSRRGGSELRAADVASVYRDAAAAWPDGTPVGLVLRPRSDSDTMLMTEIFPGLADALEGARKRPDIPIAATDGENAEMALRVPASLTGMTFLQFKTERSGLRAVNLDGVEPSLEALESGRYPHSKTLHLVTPTPPDPEAASFVRFLLSAAGGRLLREAGAAMVSAPSPA